MTGQLRPDEARCPKARAGNRMDNYQRREMPIHDFMRLSSVNWTKG